MSFTGDYIDAETALRLGPRRRGGAPRVAAASGPARSRPPSPPSPSEYVARDPARCTTRSARCRGQEAWRGRVGLVAPLDGGALRPVPPGHRAREDRGPGPGPDHGTRRRRRREGLRGHGPAPAACPRPSPTPSGSSGWATTGCTWPRRCTTPWRSRSSSAEHTERITVRTSVTLAFTRSPTLLAYAAWDIAKLSGGRFELGLGTQIRQNIEDRYAVPFGEDPIGRLGDYVGAVRAAFASFASGSAPAYESPHYRVTRLQPYFNPGPDATTLAPPIYLGGVQRRACALAGAVADGFVSHPTNSNPRYLRETCLPALAEGARAAGRDLDADGFETVIGTSVITGASPDAVAGRAGAPAPPAGLPVLDAGLRPDARALRLGRARAAPARPHPPRPLGRPGRRPLRRGARHPGPLRHLRRAARAPAASASPGWARASWCRRRPTRRDDEAFRSGRGRAAGGLSRSGLSAAWGR